MRRLGFLLIAAALVSSCSSDDGSADASPTTAPAAASGDSVTISSFPADLQLRPGQEVRVRLEGVNPRNGTLSKVTSSVPKVVRVVQRTETQGDAMTVGLRADNPGESVVAWTSTPLCACDGPPIPMRVDVHVATADG